MSQDVYNKRMNDLLTKKDELKESMKYYKNTDDDIMDRYRENQITYAKQQLTLVTDEIIKLRNTYGK